MQTLWNQLERAARLRGNTPAISCGGTTVSWPGVRDQAARMARVLADHGVKDGERIAFLSPNSLAFMALPFACEATGAIFVPLNTRYALAELVGQVRDATPALVIAAEPFTALAEQAAAEAGVACMTIDAFLGLVGSASSRDPVERTPDAPVALYYTGGTTGRSKGVILTSERLVLNALQWAHGVSARDDENLLVVAPMFHMVAALNAIITAMLACNLTILDRFTPAGTLEAIAGHRVTNIALVPSMIDMLIADPTFAKHDLSSLRMITYGGAPISDKGLDAAIRHFPGVRLYQVYGQTEGGPTISILPPEWHVPAKLRSAGKPLLLTDIRIVQPDGRPCAHGETGEILVRGPTVSPGYWNRPEEDAAAHRGGWLHTGDAGYLDDDGFLFIVDRVKDMIVTGGENVYAAEVERVLARHPHVAECAVIGVPSERWGEAVHALVRLNAGAVLDADALIGFCRQHIAAYKCPRSVEAWGEAFPLTPVGKLDKKTLRVRFAAARQAKGT